MIHFRQVCANANAPLYLVDELVNILRDKCECILWIEDIHSHGRKTFMQHLLK